MTYDLTFERLIDAPPERVFDAFVDPDAQAELYDDPTDPTWTVDSQLDLRVGGTWTIAFGPAGNDPYREKNVFTEVQRPRRLAFDSEMFIVDDGHVIRTHVTVTFEGRAGKTLFILQQTGFDRREDRDTIKGGWPSILNAIERVVAARASGGRQ